MTPIQVSRLSTATHVDGRKFWRSGRSGFATLSYLSDPDDWQEIIGTLATHIAESAPEDRSMELLDVGSGLGVTTHRLLTRLLSTHAVTARGTLIEPAQNARRFSRLLFSQSTHSLGTVKTYSAVKNLPKRAVFDAITFIHSTYYIEDFNRIIASIIDRHLISGGKVLVLVLPTRSRFFLNVENHGHLNCAEDVSSILQRARLDLSIHNMRSRLTVPHDIWESNALIEDWRSFIGFDDIGVDQFRKLLRTHLVDGVELGDKLIIGQKR